MKEYEFIRTELNYLINLQHTYTTFAFTATFIILGIAFSNKNYYLCLVPVFLVLTILLKISSLRKGVARLAAYQIVYKENVLPIKWETRLLGYFEMQRNNKTIKLGIKNRDLLFLSITCTVIYFISSVKILDSIHIILFVIAIVFNTLIYWVQNKCKYTPALIKAEIINWTKYKNEYENQD